MKIVVCVKQVPDTNEVRINKETGTLIRQGVPSIINPDDKNALEGALKIKDEHEDVEVTVLSMGPPQAKEALKEAIAMGADEAILLTDRVFAGSDTWATATILAAALEKIKDYDLIICGRQAIDGDTAQVGPEIAEFLDLPQVTYAQDMKVVGDKLHVNRLTEYGYFTVEAKMPVLVTAIKELNQPRFMNLSRIYHEVEETEIKLWTSEDIDVDLSQIGVKNSPTNVFKSFVPVREFKGIKIEGAPKDQANELINTLISESLI
jgi:electron transfer flavoprotein beta subunit